MRWLLLNIVGSLLIFSFCTQPPVLNFDNYDKLTDSLINFDSPAKVIGAGNIALNVQGEKFSGTINFQLIKNESFHADIYSILGTVVASIDGDTNRGVFNFNGKEYVFPVDSTMDSLPFNWSKHIIYREFVELLTANLSSLATIMKERPTSISNSGHISTTIWDLSDSLITLIVDRSGFKAKTLMVKNSRENWLIVFSNFKKQIAQSILFKDDEKNYFSINYEKLKYF
jgi:hypothetical protein